MRKIKFNIFASGGKLHWLNNRYQRIRYGTGCCDTFSLDYFLAKKIIRPLKRFRDTGTPGYPIGLTPKKWENILDKMVWSFERFLADDVYDKPKDAKKMQEGFELFGKYFANLWK